MSACKTCWTEASRRAHIRGGPAAEHYQTVLAENAHHATLGRCTRHAPDRDPDCLWCQIAAEDLDRATQRWDHR